MYGLAKYYRQSTTGKVPVGKIPTGKVPAGNVPYMQATDRQSTYWQSTVCKVQLAKYSWAKYQLANAWQVKYDRQYMWRATYQRPLKVNVMKTNEEILKRIAKTNQNPVILLLLSSNEMISSGFSSWSINRFVTLIVTELII